MIFEKVLVGIQGGEVLDVGCGSGQFTRVLNDLLESYSSITGVDVDPFSLEEARRNFNEKKIAFELIENGMLRFDQESFDLVCISKALHHLEDPKVTLDEMWRVLKPGGYLLINEMHQDQLSPAQESHKLYHHLRSEIDRLLGISHKHTFHRQEIIDLFNRFQFTDRMILEFNPDDSRALEPDSINDFISKMDSWLPALDGHPEKSGIIEKAAAIRERFFRFGIARPPQLVLRGKK